MRNLHRWVMTVFAVLFVYWSVSGLTLGIYDLADAEQGWSDGGGPGARPTGKPGATPIASEAVGTSVTMAVVAARNLAVSEPITALELRQTESGLQTTIDIGGAQARTLKFDAQGALLSTMPAAPMGALGAMGGPLGGMPMPGMGGPGNGTNFHSVIKNWHRGNIVGDWGVGVALFTGIALLLMIVTGVWLYLNMWQRRRAASRSGFFWS